MRMTYDPDVKAAYVYLVDSIADGESVSTQHSIFTRGKQSELILDFDSNGHLLGIEILDADQIIRPELLQSADLPGQASA